MDTTFASRQLMVNGITLNLVDAGAGEPVLLLHGFPDSSRLWRHQMPALVAAGYRVIAPDQRGFGASDKPEGTAQYAMQTLVADALGVLDACGIGRAHVVGHDWGAAVAWSLGMFVPQRVTTLAALSVSHPGTYFGSIAQYAKSWYMLLFQFAGIAERIITQDDWRLFRAWTAGAKDAEAYIRDLGRPGALTAALNWYRANATPATMFGLGGRRAAPPVQAPTLGIWGAHDPYCGESGFVDPQGTVAGPYRYERIEDAGHWLPLDQPERVTSLLLGHFRTHPMPA